MRLVIVLLSVAVIGRDTPSTRRPSVPRGEGCAIVGVPCGRSAPSSDHFFALLPDGGRQFLQALDDVVGLPLEHLSMLSASIVCASIAAVARLRAEGSTITAATWAVEVSLAGVDLCPLEKPPLVAKYRMARLIRKAIMASGGRSLMRSMCADDAGGGKAIVDAAEYQEANTGPDPGRHVFAPTIDDEPDEAEKTDTHTHTITQPSVSSSKNVRKNV